MTQRPRRPEPAPADRLGDDELAAGDLIGFVAAEEAVVEQAPERGPLLRRLSSLAGPLVRFALVGGVGFLVDTAIFNALLATVLDPAEVAGGAVWAKVIATLVAITTNWIGNRLWTFRHDRRSDEAKEGLEFFTVSLVGLVIGLIPVWITELSLGLHDVLSLNVAMVVGLVAGSVFRFACYRLWVFSPKRSGSAARRRAAAEAAAAQDAGR